MKLIKEIKSKDGVVHFRRWELIKTRWFSIWLHGIYEADKDLHLHNHPWDYKSVVLKGSYIEETNDGQNTLKPGTFTSRNGAQFHKIKKLLTKKVYTLFMVSPVRRDWGYIVNGRFIQHEDYRKLKRGGEV